MIRCRQMGLFQVDVSAHAHIAKSMSPGLMLEAKMQLGHQLEHLLWWQGLRCLNWAGDGGIFGIECRRPSDFDSVVLAGEISFRVVRDVNASYLNQLPRDCQMSLRVSGHFGSLFTVPDPRFWHGEDLNWFVKNERHLATPGMFSITKQLRDKLSQEQRLKFPDS
jgi:hypothetical protein